MKEKIFFKDSESNKICGILSNPNKETINTPIIILCHGFTTSKASTTYKTMETVLNKEKIATLRIDFFGHGESEGKFEDLTIDKASDCILKAIEFLESKKFTKIGLFGSSFGGFNSIIAASKTNKLTLLVLKCPVSDYIEQKNNNMTKEELENWKNQAFIIHKNSYGEERRLNYSFYENLKKYNGHKAAENIKIPTLIIHGDNDSMVPIGQSIKTAKLIENCKLEIIKGANHKFSKTPKHFEKI